jgi:uncharacterized protein YodC (DUF2158 family)
MELRAGDIVRFKAGGPKMVAINKAGEADGFYCQYFDRLGRAQTSYFLTRNLELVVDPVNERIAA